MLRLPRDEFGVAALDVCHGVEAVVLQLEDVVGSSNGAARFNVDGVFRQPPPEATLLESSGNTAKFLVRWWTNPQPAEVMRLQDRVVLALARAVSENGAVDAAGNSESVHREFRI